MRFRDIASRNITFWLATTELSKGYAARSGSSCEVANLRHSLIVP
jgi:hypothetical protein